jgi:hypothetical protein
LLNELVNQREGLANECQYTMDIHNNNIGRGAALLPRDMFRIMMFERGNPNEAIARAVASAVKGGKTINGFNDPRMPKECHVLAKQRGDFYIWHTMRDDKVRLDHRWLEARVMAWQNPPQVGNPGHDYGCRCWAEPYEPKNVEILDILKRHE